MNLTVSNTNRILRSGNGPTVEYTGQDPIQVNNATHIISLNSAFSAQFAESGVEAKVDELSSCCEQVHSSISSLETQVNSLSSTVETISSELPDFATKEWVTDQGYLTQIPDGYLTKAEAEVTYQPIGNYLTSADIQNKLDVSALEYTDQGKISAYNGSAFVGEGGGTTYTPGQYISIDSNNEISVTGLQPEGDYVTDTELQSVSSDLKDLIPSTDSFLTKASADTLYQPIGDYQPAGDYLTSEDITGFATRDEVSSYLLKDEFTETSSFLQTEISSLSAIVTSASDDYELIEGDYIKLTDNSANHTTEISVTGLPNFSDYASTGDLNALSSLVDSVSSDVISISSTVSSSVTSLSSDIQYVSANCLTAHQSLDDYYKKTETSSKQEISAALASIQPGDAEVQQVVRTYSAEGKWLIASDLDPYLQKSESGVFQPSGNYLSANALEGYATEQWVNEQGFIKTETDWTNTIKEASANAYNEAVAQIPAPFDPTYLSGEIDKKLDKSFSSNFYPMNSNPSGYLTAHQSLTDYATTAQVNTVSSLLSAGLDYVSANAGKTYTGVAPIQVDNELNEISITGEGLSAGPNIDIFSSGGYVIISGSSGRDFTNEITAASAYAYNSATAQINSTSSYLSAALDYVSGNAGSNYTGISPIYVNNVSKQISADTWTLIAGSGVTFTDDNVNKVTVLDVTGVNTYCFNFPNGVTSVDLSTFNNYNKVTIVHSNDNMPDYHLYWDGKTKVIPSGLYCEMVKGKDNLNNIKWSFAQSAWINDNWWDWD